MTLSFNTRKKTSLESALGDVEIARPEMLPPRGHSAKVLYAVDGHREPANTQPPLTLPGASFGYGDTTGDQTKVMSEADIKRDLHKLRIEIAPNATSEGIHAKELDQSYRYFRASFGVDMLVPVGWIEDLRFRLDFTSHPSSDEFFVRDGFPRDDIKITPNMQGKFSISLDKLLKFVPYGIGDFLPISFTLDSREFSIGGANKKISVAFCGAQTRMAEWYAKGGAVQQSFAVTVLLQVPPNVNEVKAQASAEYVYDQGLWWRAHAHTLPPQSVTVPLPAG